MPELKRLPAVFYTAPSGREPVREWLLTLDEGSRRTVGRDIATAEFGWPIGMPVCRKVEASLFEIRSKITSGRIGRVLIMPHEGRMVLLHAFVKKSQKIPRPDLDLARKRAKEITS